MADQTKRRDIIVVAAVIVQDGKVLAAKRKPGGPSGGLWEFAGGKVETGETPQEALAREIKEELGLDVRVGEELGLFVTELEPYTIHLQCFWCTVEDGCLKLVDHDDAQWCSLAELNGLTWALPDLPAVRQIQEGGVQAISVNSVSSQYHQDPRERACK